jgi:hypothetical protein
LPSGVIAMVFGLRPTAIGGLGGSAVLWRVVIG